MWRCPKCKQRFVNRNQSHSCGNYSVTQFLAGKSSTGIGLFKWFLSEYRKIGTFSLHPVKTRVALLTKMRFCAINKVGEDFIDVHLVLTKLYKDQRFHRIDNLADRFFVHHMKIQKKSDITRQAKKYMRLAYEVGKRIHVRSGKSEA